MQSDNTSKKTRKVTPKASAAVTESAPAETVKTARAKKPSPSKSSAAEKSSASPKHHHSAAVPKSLPPHAVVEDKVEYTNEDIARLAHSFWESRNFAHGYAHEDWLRAEAELGIKR
jgi:hypothetical protein